LFGVYAWLHFKELILDIIKEGRIVPSEISVRKAIEMNNANKVLIDSFPRYEKNRNAFKRIASPPILTTTSH
jgi:adenylate kinase family enzyme